MIYCCLKACSFICIQHYLICYSLDQTAEVRRFHYEWVGLNHMTRGSVLDCTRVNVHHCAISTLSDLFFHQVDIMPINSGMFTNKGAFINKGIYK